jgi:hypothetical protein
MVNRFEFVEETSYGENIISMNYEIQPRGSYERITFNKRARYDQ